jgi:CheY-like chemotaxis protein
VAHILVVDDEHDVVTLIKFLLEKDGHRVSTAYNGAEALAALGVEPQDQAAPLPDLVIIDVMMPVLDGYSTCARLAQEARTRALPLLVLTAKGDTKDLFQQAPNVAAQLDKPFDPKALRDLIAHMLPPARPEARRG